MRYILFLFFLPLYLFAFEYKIASYNVENLFDTDTSGYEYKEYIPNAKSGWNDKMLTIKIKNIAKVIKDIDADIIALQEVENKEVLKKLNLALGNKKYPFMYMDFKNKGVDSALLSKFPIKEHKTYNVNQRFRAIHKVVVDIKGLHVNLFLNHWPSYKNGNKKRMDFAKRLQKLIQKERNYILLGDFNSPLYVDKNGWGKAAKYISKDNHNLWYELPYKYRVSYSFFKQRHALDHIIISKDINYVESSFDVFRKEYLSTKYKTPFRWQIGDKGKGKHKGVGYSDHFPIMATFSTQEQSENKYKVSLIKELLDTGDFKSRYLLKDVMVVDENRYGVVLEDKKHDKIFLYKPDCKLEIGNIYTLHVKELAVYKGKKEIVLLDFNYCLDKM